MPACIEGAIEGRKDAAAGVRIVDGRAKDKAICLLGGSDQLVHHVIVKGAAAIELAALTTANAVACAGGVAVCLGAAIDQKNLHHKLPLLSVTSAEDYRTMGEAVWARC